MLTERSENNTEKNKSHYDKVYSEVRIDSLLKIVKDVKKYLSDVTAVDTSWVCMYQSNFSEEIIGKKVLELGCGNCYNVAVMAALGAEVYANDISEKSGEIIEKLNKEVQFEYPITYIQGDFLRTEQVLKEFDYVIGKAFVHHLTHEQEELFLEKISDCLKLNGQVRFVEPAVNNRLLDRLRWLVPVPGRPSSFQVRKFQLWKQKDPHPDRDNSGKHYKKVGLKYFKEAEVVSVGSIERFHRLFPKAKWNRDFRKNAYKMERRLPKVLQYELARTQTIHYKFPIR